MTIATALIAAMAFSNEIIVVSAVVHIIYGVFVLFSCPEAFAHTNKVDWLSDSDSQNTIICSTTSSSPGPSLASTSTSGGQKIGSSKGKAGRSKETPAGQKPAQVVARRNARERRRVQAVNWAFARLRKVVPLEENK